MVRWCSHVVNCSCFLSFAAFRTPFRPCDAAAPCCAGTARAFWKFSLVGALPSTRTLSFLIACRFIPALGLSQLLSAFLGENLPGAGYQPGKITCPTLLYSTARSRPLPKRLQGGVAEDRMSPHLPFEK